MSDILGNKSRSQLGPCGYGIAADDPLFTSYKDAIAVIYRRVKNQMQAGTAKAVGFCVIFVSKADIDAKSNQSTMQWVSAKSNLNQIELEFDNLEAAKNYLNSKCFKYIVAEEENSVGANFGKKIIRKKSYGDNFC